jgi:hypothetical protein
MQHQSFNLICRNDINDDIHLIFEALIESGVDNILLIIELY